MAGYLISVFDWHKFNELISPPATDLSEATADFLRQRGDIRLSTFPKDKTTLPAVLAEFFTSDDWHGSESLEDCEAIESLVDAIINKIKADDLQTKPINDGVSLDLIYLIQGRFAIDQKRSKPHPGETYFKLTGTENPDMPEFQAFGGRPFRHPSYDLEAAANYNPYEEDEERYIAMYSIHSPEQVAVLVQEAEAAGSLLEGVGDEEILEEYQQQLVAPLHLAQKVNQAIYVTTDT